MHKSSIYLPDELKRSLAELAVRTGRSEADLIRLAIERLLAMSDTAAPAPPSAAVPRLRPSVVGVGVGPGEPGLITDRARAALNDADRVIVITTDARSVGRAEMVVRSVAPTAHLQRVPFEIGGDHEARHQSLVAVADAVVAGVDGGEMVAVAVIGDPAQWTVFPDLARHVASARPMVPISAEPGITSYQAAAASAVATLGQPGSALVVLDDAHALAHHLQGSDSVVLYKASTDSATVRLAAAMHGRHDAVVAELSGLPGQRLVALDDSPDGPISYLATIVFPARRPVAATHSVGSA